MKKAMQIEIKMAGNVEIVQVFLAIILHYIKTNSSNIYQNFKHKHESKMKTEGKLISVFYASN